MSEVAVVSTEKDRVFKIIFNNREKLLSLYNALANTSYEDATKLEVNTLEDVVYIGMKNDLSFILDGRMNLYEQQSSVNPNMPLRGLYYIADLYKQRYSGKQLYSSKLLRIPTPQYVVFYNGLRDMPDRQDLRLSDAFEHATNTPDVEVIAHVININIGHNEELMKKCKVLFEYSVFNQRVRAYMMADIPKETAVEKAVNSCIEDDILGEILRKDKARIMASILSEFDEVGYAQMLREEGIEEGISQGISQGETKKLIELVCKKLRKNKTPELIAEELEEEESVIKAICETAKRHAPEYDEEKIYQEWLQ